MPDKELAIVIRAKDKATKIVRGLRGGLEGLKNTAAKLKKAFLISTAAVAAGFIALGLAIRKVTAASGVQEDAEKRLQQAMEASGNFTQKAYRDLLNYASALQEVTRFGDENTISMMANLQTYGMEKEELKKATKATVDLAAAKKMDLFAASELVGKAFVGETGTLSRYGIIIDASIPKTEKFAAVLKLINERFGGAAQSEAKTYIGIWAQIGNTWGDIKEVVGDAITKNKTVLDILGRVGDALKRAKKYLEDHREELKKYVTRIIEVAEKLSQYVFPIIRTAARVFKDAAKEVINFFDRLTGGSLQLQIDDTMEAIEEINKEIERTKEIYRETGKEVEDFFGWESNLNELNKRKIELQEKLNTLLKKQAELKKEVAKIEEKEVPKVIGEDIDFVKGLPMTVEAALSAMKDYWKKYFKDIFDESEKTKQEMMEHTSSFVDHEATLLAQNEALYRKIFGKELSDFNEKNEELINKSKDTFNYMHEMSIEAARNMQRTFSDFFFNTMKGEFNSFKDFLKSFGDSMLRIWSDYMAQMAAQSIFGKEFLSGKSTSIGGIIGGIGGWIGGLFTGEKGGILPGGFRAFQEGGIAREPTLGLFGEGKRAEAFVPLPDNRSIPVKFLNRERGDIKVYNIFNIRAIDGASVARFFQENKEVLWNVTAQGFSQRTSLREIMMNNM